MQTYTWIDLTGAHHLPTIHDLLLNQLPRDRSLSEEMQIEIAHADYTIVDL